MSVIKTFILSLVIVILCFFGGALLEEPIAETPFALSTDFSNKDKAYQFEVPEDGQMMRFEINGTMKMNSWQAMDMEVYNADGTYIFSYQDELWSESGRDSEGDWTERKTKASLEIHFAKKGHYTLYLTDSNSYGFKFSRDKYYFRVIPIRGDASMLRPLRTIAGIIAFGCFCILAYRHENGYALSGKKPFDNNTKYKREPIYIGAISLSLFAAVFLYAQTKDDDINYALHAYGNKKMTVDRSIRQQSLSGANHRGGSGRGGK
ncbi:hypothetical protein [Pseudoalteromonas sp. R3]|uniref:hypothetical protein n=1 Tax=Pseudoalteromonas sp. R3 TaxID=1709477 RepID=UPI0006B67E23|nr:hypothetical protein [Pseudoalteromonas sp. R3]AZZ96425.1 hypothetical protein ELR70_04400 [Pseudoalteromonas sp. R3]